MRQFKLLFDVTLLDQAAQRRDGQRTGIFFTALHMLKEFCRRPEFEVTVYTPYHGYHGLKKLFEDYKIKNCRCDYNKKTEYDAYFSPVFPAPEEIRNNPKIKKYTVLYDLIPLLLPEFYKEAVKKDSWFMQLISSLNVGEHYFAISEYTKKDILKKFPYMSSENITVASLACADTFKPVKDNAIISKVRQKYNIPEGQKYIFSLCTLEPRKNLIRTVKTFVEFIKKNKIDDLIFVLGGAHWDEFYEKLQKEVKGLGKYKNKIKHIGYVDDGDLSALYSGAEWFVYTSQYEGFGLPPLEAMACGCPVISSNNTSLPEVVGQAGQMIDWESDEQHIAAYEKYYFDDKFRKSMARKGLERSKLFSWQKCCDVMAKKIRSDLQKINTVPVVFISSGTYTIPTGVAITSLVANKEPTTQYEIYIITNGVSEKDNQRFKKLDNGNDIRIHLLPYEDNNALKEFETDGYYVAGACILKFNISDMLPQYDKILYLDGDIIIREDLAGLYNIDLKDKYAGVVGDFHGCKDLCFRERLHIPYYFNAGVMLLNAKKIRKEKLMDKFYKLRREHPQWQCMDQDVHNYVFKDKIKKISPRYNLQFFNFHICHHSIEDVNTFYDTNYASFDDMLQKGAIIHLTNYQKPWEYKAAFLADEWLKYYKKSPFGKIKLKYKDASFAFLKGLIKYEKREGHKCCTLQIKLFEKEKTPQKKWLKILGFLVYKKTKMPKKHALAIMGMTFYKKRVAEKKKKTYLLGIPFLKTTIRKGKTTRYFCGLPVYHKTKKPDFSYQKKDQCVNVLFDASVLSYGVGKTPSRSGVYFVIYNVIKGLLKDKRINLALMCGDDEQKKNLKDVFARYYKENKIPPIVYGYDAPLYQDLFDAYFTPLHAIPQWVTDNPNIIPYEIFYDLDPIIHPKSFPDSDKPDFWFKRLVESIDERCVNFVISEYTKKDFLKYVAKADKEKTITTLLAADKSFSPATKEKTHDSLRKYNLPTDKKYIFSLCNLQPRKNLIRVIRTFLQFIQKHKIEDMVFILGGAAWCTFENEFRQEMEKPECKNKIIHAGYIDDEDLAPLYSGAQWFVYTSSFEGFGLPPLEAMSCGCPVITSNNTSLPEVVGDAGQMIDWDSDAQHIAAYEKYYFDDKFRQTMAQKGLKRARQFSWQTCCNIMADEMVKNKQGVQI